ncbi:MAG: rhodanese-like domain-containing protein [bacterium]|nr:rhodanese-like domain-containing protein [Candidatus Sumerlaeota bacterium]
MSFTCVTVREIAEKLKQGGQIDLIDVRTPREYEAVHATGARLFPLNSLNASSVMAVHNGRNADPLYILCKSGARARQAARKFIEAGYPNIVVIDGGTVEWEKAGLPIERGRRAMPVDCQARIVMGSMVLLGIVLGFALHPLFTLISGFVGCGLIMAGITDNCPLANMIAVMPWNRSASSGASCCVRR